MNPPLPFLPPPRMNPKALHLVAFALAFAGPFAATAQDRKNLAMRDATSHDELSRSLRMAQQKDPVRDLGPAIGKSDEDPAKRNAGRDLIKESTILCYRGFLTLVPKKAVLHLPEHLKDRFVAKDGIQVVTWKDFHQGNRGWIRTLEVSREQAMGQAPLPEEIVKSFETSTSVVVATFKGGPISVVPYKEPEPAADGATAAPRPENATSAAAPAEGAAAAKPAPAEPKPAPQP